MNAPKKYKLSVAVGSCDITTAAFILMTEGEEYAVYVRKEPAGLCSYIQSRSSSGPLMPFESFIKAKSADSRFFKEMEQKAKEKAKDMFDRTDRSLVMTLHEGYSLLAATIFHGKLDYGWLDMMTGDQLFHYLWKKDGDTIKVTLIESIGSAAEPRFVKEEITSILTDLVARSLFRHDRPGKIEPLYTLSGIHEIAKEKHMKPTEEKTRADIPGTCGKGMGGVGAERIQLAKELQKQFEASNEHPTENKSK